jgi:Ran GTPase-activating protein (RanGAP) involved in mRNA processing and transport
MGLHRLWTDICNFLMSPCCHLSVLDLSWNVIGEKGAITFASALPLNASLLDLNLASNSIGDNGGQRIVKSLKHHTKLATFNISQNEIADGTCFVVAQVSDRSRCVCADIISA